MEVGSCFRVIARPCALIQCMQVKGMTFPQMKRLLQRYAVFLTVFLPCRDDLPSATSSERQVPLVLRDFSSNHRVLGGMGHQTFWRIAPSQRFMLGRLGQPLRRAQIPSLWEHTKQC